MSKLADFIIDLEKLADKYGDWEIEYGPKFRFTSVRFDDTPKKFKKFFKKFLRLYQKHYGRETILHCNCYTKDAYICGRVL